MMRWISFLCLAMGLSGSAMASAENANTCAKVDEMHAASISRQYSPQVVCDYYNRGGIAGYSLYRSNDGVDLANAIWTDTYECDRAASLANSQRAGLVCGRYANRATGTVSYSVYRIYDNKDLGKASIGDFESCQGAVASARRGVFCSTYVQNSQVYWSIYDIRSGADIGSKLYGTLAACEAQY